MSSFFTLLSSAVLFCGAKLQQKNDIRKFVCHFLMILCYYDIFTRSQEGMGCPTNGRRGGSREPMSESNSDGKEERG
jgi:hypothetical protein